MDYLKHGETRDFGVLFVDEDGNYFDPTDPTYEVSHYEKDNGTTNWVQDVPEAVLYRISIGHYSFTWFVDENIYTLGEVYYFRFRGTDTEGTRNIDERTAKIIDESLGGGGGSSSCGNGLIARFVF